MNNNHSDHTPGHLQLLTTAQVAELLSVSLRTVQSWVKDGALPHVRLGEGQRLVRIRTIDLERFIETYYQSK